MELFVADANAVLATLLPDEDANLAERFNERMKVGDTLTVPGLWHIEVSNVPLNKVRRKTMTLDEAQEDFETVQEYRVRTDTYSAEPSVIRHIWRLAIKHQLTTYDATYLELAVRLGCPLLTADAALIRAAPLEGVKLL